MKLNIEGNVVEVDDSFEGLSPEQQNATVDEIASSLGVGSASVLEPVSAPVEQGGWKESVLQSIPEGQPRALASGVLTGVAQIPRALSQVAQPAIDAMQMANYAGGAGAMPSSSGTRPVSSIDLPKPDYYQWGRSQGPLERQARSGRELTASLGEAAPAIAAGFAAGAPPAAATLPARLVAAGVESAATGVLTPAKEDSFDAKLAQAATDFGLGGAFKLGGAGLGAVGSWAQKYNPFKSERSAKLAATRTLSKWQGKDSTWWKERLARHSKLRGEEATDLMDMPSMLGKAEGSALRTVKEGFAAAASPEAASKMTKKQLARDTAVSSSVDDLLRTMQLSEPERALVREAYTTLDTIPLDPYKWGELSQNPQMKEFVEPLVEKNPALRRQLEGLDPMGVAYWDKIKREVQFKYYRMKSSVAGETPTTQAGMDELGAFIKQIKSATDDAAEGVSEYKLARSLSQRDILSRELEDVFGNAQQVSLGGGKWGLAPSSIASLTNRSKWNTLNEIIDGVGDKQYRTHAKRTLRLVRDLAHSAQDSGRAASKVGATESPYVDLAGVISTGGRELGTKGRESYNNAILHLIDHPKEFAELLEQVEKLDAAKRRYALNNLLAQTTSRMMERETAQEATQ